MRHIRTFLLRLLFDPADPHALQGTLQAATGGDRRPFTGQHELAQTLRAMAIDLEVVNGAPSIDTPESGSDQP